MARIVRAKTAMMDIGGLRTGLEGATMQIIRYRTASGAVGTGIDRDGIVSALPFASMAELLRTPLEQLRTVTDAARGRVADVEAVLAPIDGRTEVWASGVTYLRSRDARTEESQHERAYNQVYEAERPELFFKSPAWRAVTGGEPVGIRDDSDSNVPEPELCLAINSSCEIVGYLICNDMSSRSIEGENTLYLPQAKSYAGACSLSAGIRPAWEIDASNLVITMAIERAGETVFHGETSTSKIQRSFADLAVYLMRAQSFPDGALLSTGAGIVPELSFTLEPGDRVDIAIDGLGRLVNEVAIGVEPFEFLDNRH